MILFLEHRGRCFHRQVISRPWEFTAPFNGDAYPCLIWSHGPPLALKDRWDLAERLVASQCRYAVCGGQESTAIHDDVDSAYIRPFLAAATMDVARPLVMTTSHEGEPFAEVASFFVSSTNFDEHAFANYLVLHIGGTVSEHAALDVAVARAALGEAAV